MINQEVDRDGSYTRIQKTHPEPAPFIVGMGVKNWKKMGMGRVR